MSGEIHTVGASGAAAASDAVGASDAAAASDATGASNAAGVSDVSGEIHTTEPSHSGERHTTRSKRFVGLDGLRALAALAIVAHHVGFASGATFNSPVGGLLARLDIGVPVFFALSGFLLFRPIAAAILNDAPLRSTRVHLWRRAMRIYPAYWVALLLIVVFTSESFRDLGAATTTFALVHIHWADNVIGPMPQAWSLATEVSFYALLPLIARLLRPVVKGLSGSIRSASSEPNRVTSMFVCVVGLYLFSIFFRLYLHGLGRDWTSAALLWLPAQIDYFAIGMGIAVSHVGFKTGSSARDRLQRWAAPAGWWWLAGAVIFVVVAEGLGLARGLAVAPWPQEMLRQFGYGIIAFTLLFPLVFAPHPHPQAETRSGRAGKSLAGISRLRIGRVVSGWLRSGWLRGGRASTGRAGSAPTHTGQARIGIIRRVTGSRVLTGLGKISYSIYLWHMVFIVHPWGPAERAVDRLWNATVRSDWMETIVGWTGIINVLDSRFVVLAVTAVVPTLAVAAASYALLERAGLAAGRAGFAAGRADVVAGRAGVVGSREGVVAGGAGIAAGRTGVVAGGEDAAGREDVVAGRAGVVGGREDVVASEAGFATDRGGGVAGQLGRLSNSPATGPGGMESVVARAVQWWRTTSFRAQMAVIAGLAAIVRFGYVLTAKRTETLNPDSVFPGDQFYYALAGDALADGKGFVVPWHDTSVALGLADASQAAPHAADHPPLTAIVAALGGLLPGPPGTHVLEQRLTMASLGVVAVVLIGLLGRAIAGNAAGLTAAALAAVYAGLWVNDGLVMAETLVAVTLAGALWAAVRYRKMPTVRGVLELGLWLGGAVLARSELILLAPLIVVPLMWATHHKWSTRIARATVVAAVTVGLCAPWVVTNLVRFSEPVLMSTNVGATLAGANSPQTYHGDAIGFWTLEHPLTLVDTAGLDQSEVSSAYTEVAIDYALNHPERWPAVIAARIGRTWSIYRPLQMVDFNQGEGREVWASLLALGGFGLLVPVAAVGWLVLRKRRSHDRTLGWLLTAPFVHVTLVAGLFYGLARLRVPAEISLLVLAAIAITSVRSCRRVPTS